MVLVVGSGKSSKKQYWKWGENQQAL